MSISRTETKAPRSADEGAVSNGGWLTLDLAGLPLAKGKALAAATSAPVLAPVVPAPALPAINPAQDNVKVETPVPVEPSPAPQVPLDRIVVIGKGLPPGHSFGRRRVVPAIANDNKAAARKGRTVLREVFFMAVLAAALAGAFYNGQVHAMQKVIVIPEPMDRRVVLT
jgi:hypothetical protein